MPIRVDPRWRKRVQELRAANPKLGPDRIALLLKAEASFTKTGTAPSRRTVARMIEDFENLPIGEQLALSVARWPDSFLSGILPWEYAPAVLELIGQLHRAGRGRPLHRVAMWFGRVTQAAPDLPFDARLLSAWQLAAWESLGGSDSKVGTSRSWEWFFAYAPWRSDEASTAYDGVVGRAGGTEGHNDPSVPERVPSLVDWGDSEDRLLDVLEALSSDAPWSPDGREDIRQQLRGVPMATGEHATEEEQ